MVCLPPGAIPPSETRALLAVIGGARTVREVGAACGWSSTYAYDLLGRLRERRLVAWEDGQAGTLRALVGR